MKTTRLRRSDPVLLYLLVSLSLGAGCGTPRPRQYDVKVVPAPSIASSSTLVDLIGATPSDLPDWQAYSITKYWRPGDPRRRDAEKFTLKIGTDQSLVLSATNSIWKAWFARGVDHLVIIADLPGVFDEGPADPRRKVIPLYPKEWKDNPKALEVQIQESRILILTPERLQK